MITSLSLTKNISLIVLLCCTLSFAFANTEIVMNTNDSGAGSLRQAVVDAMPGDTISFAASLDMMPITLTGSDIDLDKDVVIIGNGATNTIIDGNANSRIFHITAGNTVNIHGVTLQNGNAPEGGGVYNLGGQATFNNSTISGNTANIGGGGGVYIDGGVATFTNTTISGNTAFQGGGVFHKIGQATFTNITISGNSAAFGGGGVHNLGGQATFTNSIVAKNTDGGLGPDIYNSIDVNFTDGGNNLIGDGTGQSIIIDNNNGNKVGTAGSLLDPLFITNVPSTAIGPSTGGDLRLQSNSPAIDMGDNADVLTPYDKDGYQRIIGGTVDIGAHEYLGTCTGAGNKNFFVTTTANGGSGSLRDHVSKACSGDTIRFAAITDGYPINLITEITLSKDIVIIGNYTTNTIIDGNANSRIFHVTPGTNVVIDSITLQNGNALFGGAVRNEGVLSVFNSKISGNTANQNGGGMFNSGVATFINSSISGNTANLGGGSMFNSGVTTFNNSTISGNTAPNGGGVFNGAQATFINTTISGNTAFDGGGVINLSGQATFINTTISGNTASEGGGVYSLAQATFTNSIIAKNTGVGTGQEILNLSTIIDGGNNLIGDGTGQSDIMNNNNGNKVGTAGLPLNPHFIMDVPSTAMGPSTGGDLHLQPTSSAINAGNTASLSPDIFDLDGDGDVLEPHPLDLSGSTRVVECTVDIGAYEYQTVLQTIRYVNKTASGNNDGTSWPDAFLHLQDALRLRCGAAEIWVAEGAYDPDEGAGLTDGDRSASFIMQNNLKILGGFPDMGDPGLADRDPESNETILVSLTTTGSPDPANRSYHVIRNEDNGLDTTAVLDGFLIQGGLADGMGADAFGAGIYNKNSSPLISNCEISLNEASQAGGGVYNQGSAPIFRHIRFWQNNATAGGAMFNNLGSAPIVVHSTFDNNKATDSGGALYHLGENTRLINCELFNNEASNEGGAIYNLGFPMGMDVINCSFYDNSAPIGASAYNSSNSANLNIFNSILWGAQGTEIINSGSATVAHSIVQGGWPGTGNFDEDPHFVGPTDLRLSVACSPAINSGLDSYNTTTLDLKGNNRKVGTIDMGAFEFQGPAAGTITFDAGGNATDWHDANNWDLNIIPARCHDVIIPSPHNVMIRTSNTGIGKTLQVDVGAMLETASGGLMDIDKR